MFEAFEAGLKKVLCSPEYVALTELGRRPKIVVVVDALSSTPGLLMPWERVVGLCKRHENIWSLVDAAQAIGQIVGIDLSKIQPDFFISVGDISAERLPAEINPHAPAGLPQMAVLEARMRGSLRTAKVAPQHLRKRKITHIWFNRNQHLIRTTLHPSAAYIPPEDYIDDPTLPKPPNFAKQFECAWVSSGLTLAV